MSKYELLREMIAMKLGVPFTNVDIFTVMNHPTLPRTIDLRYSAHGSPYYRPARLDGIVNQFQDEVSLSCLFKSLRKQNELMFDFFQYLILCMLLNLHSATSSSV